MIRGFLDYLLDRPAPEPEPCGDDTMVEALRDLVEAQSGLLGDFRRALLEEKRVSRDVALFATHACEPWAQEMADEMHRNLCDRVARAEEHQL